MPYERLNPPEDGILTDREERVRSKSELIIANALNSQNIPYRYEQKLTIKGRDIYPDFNILNVRKQKEIIWEHFGLMDDPEYVAKTVRKISEYSANGFQIGDNLIVTFENNHTPLNTIQVNYYIKNFLK